MTTTDHDLNMLFDRMARARAREPAGLEDADTDSSEDSIPSPEDPADVTRIVQAIREDSVDEIPGGRLGPAEPETALYPDGPPGGQRAVGPTGTVVQGGDRHLVAHIGDQLTDKVSGDAWLQLIRAEVRRGADAQVELLVFHRHVAYVVGGAVALTGPLLLVVLVVRLLWGSGW